MDLNLKILKTIVDYGMPISIYKISKLLNESFNAVKYNVKQLEEHKTILAVEREDKPKNTYYVPNALFTEKDELVEHLTPIVGRALDTVEMDEHNARFNFKMLLSLIVNDIVDGANGRKENHIPRTNR
jgi:predicted transcriptional regulator